MPLFCRYSTALGRPREGVHSVRLFDTAVVDVAGTFALGYVTSRMWPHRVSFIEASTLWFAAGFAAHWLFCVPTKWMLEGR